MVIGPIDRRLAMLMPYDIDPRLISNRQAIGEEPIAGIGPPAALSRVLPPEDVSAIAAGGGFAPAVTGDPFATAESAREFGIRQGLEQVAARQAAQEAAGLGRFTDPRTGGSAIFGLGQFLNRPAAFEMDMNTQVQGIKESVQRRLEELMGGGSPFQSPTPPLPPPPQPPSIKRGRFGT